MGHKTSANPRPLKKKNLFTHLSYTTRKKSLKWTTRTKKNKSRHETAKNHEIDQTSQKRHFFFLELPTTRCVNRRDARRMQKIQDISRDTVDRCACAWPRDSHHTAQRHRHTPHAPPCINDITSTYIYNSYARRVTPDGARVLYRLYRTHHTQKKSFLTTIRTNFQADFCLTKRTVSVRVQTPSDASSMERRWKYLDEIFPTPSFCGCACPP